VLTVTLVRGSRHGPGGWIAPTNDPIVAQIPFTLGGTPGIPGSGSWTQPYVINAGFWNETRRYRVEIYDPAAPGGIARTNATLLSYGF
jgi:hypothetical protein